jgi:hypothetical protein
MESIPNIEKIKTALKGYLWTKGAPTKVAEGIRRYDSVAMLLLRAGVPEYEISTLKMSDTWARFGTVLKNEYGLRDIVDYYLVLIAGDSSTSADDMIARVEKALAGDLSAIAPFYRGWIAKIVSDRKTLPQ